MREPPAALPGRLVLLGHPVAQSLSPAFQNAALRAAGIPLTYEALDVPPNELAATLDALAAARAAGNVTVPHKEAVFARCDRVTPLAARVGAVNTWWVADGLLLGHNTDVGGFDAAVAELFEGPRPADARVALLGAGGSAAAVLAAVEGWAGARFRVWGRSAARAHALARRFESRVREAAVAETVAECVRDATLVVNATPLGLRPDDGLPVPVELLPPDAAVLDLVYKPQETPWVREARARGHRAADGLAMLIEQGALSFERWFGVAPDRDVMWAAVGGRRGARPTTPAGG